MAPQHSGFIGAVISSAGSIAAVVLPYLVAALTPNGSRKQWANVFYVSAGVGASGGVFFLIFGSADLQSWADEKKSAQTELEDIKY